MPNKPEPSWEEALREQVAKIMVDYGIDFYEGNLMHRTEQRLSLIEDFKTDCVSALTDAVEKLVKEAKPPYEQIKDLHGGWDKVATYHAHRAIDTYQTNLIKLIRGDVK